ncbi:polymer-forming cytoskeletal protein [uncultured Brachyspira sp.]|uniref:bactofilin family protein n=1 Tax=uncultured Brachyspira sp. TaxID=221953 RepID=UPI002629F67F|nr:polymer-forming cytoskeletal protein [uncultured Brachyspira sp.]
MFMKRNESTESNSIIGEGSYFKGEFTLNGTLRVNGCYEGEILEVDNVFVGQTGKVKSNIKTVSAVIEGIIIGNIEAKNRVMLMPTSRVLGEIRTPELIIQNGVILEGLCIVAPDPLTNPRETILSLYNNNTDNNGNK